MFFDFSLFFGTKNCNVRHCGLALIPKDSHRVPADTHGTVRCLGIRPCVAPKNTGWWITGSADLLVSLIQIYAFVRFLPRVVFIFRSVCACVCVVRPSPVVFSLLFAVSGNPGMVGPFQSHCGYSRSSGVPPFSVLSPLVFVSFPPFPLAGSWLFRACVVGVHEILYHFMLRIGFYYVMLWLLCLS